MKNVTPINSAPKLPNWPQAAEHMRNAGAFDALCALLGVQQGTQSEMHAAVIAALEAQPAPATSIYDRQYTAHVYPEPGVAMGQVYEALRDYAAQHATPDPAMVEIRNREILALLDSWKAEGPPSAEDVEFWRQFDADLARARRGGDSDAVAELKENLAGVIKRAEHAEALNRELNRKLSSAEQLIAELTAPLVNPERG